MNISEANAGSATRLRGKTALVTGSTAGLGLAIARGLAVAGCNIVMTGLASPDEIEVDRMELAEQTGVCVIYHQGDLSSLAGVEALVQAAMDRFDTLDVLVNNAVVRHFAPIVEFPPQNWDIALAVNLSAAFHAIRLLLPGMRERNYGRIFNLTSVYGLRGTVDRVGYVTTKSALLGLTRSVALENLDYDVTCHSICPGSVLTPGTEERVLDIMREQSIPRDKAERSFLEGKQPSGHFVSSQSVSDLMLFLCGPVARDMTGALLPVEGGWLAS